jgi:hypothetical protein
MAFNGTGSNVTSLNAANISSGTVATDRLATSGTASNTTFLRGDQTWSAPASSGGAGDVVVVSSSSMFTSSGTYTVPTLAADEHLYALMIGGGGSGGAMGVTTAASQRSYAQGGGGRIGMALLNKASLGATVVYTIGAGGAGVVGPVQVGSSGTGGGTTLLFSDNYFLSLTAGGTGGDAGLNESSVNIETNTITSTDYAAISITNTDTINPSVAYGTQYRGRQATSNTTTFSAPLFFGGGSAGHSGSTQRTQNLTGAPTGTFTGAGGSGSTTGTGSAGSAPGGGGGGSSRSNTSATSGAGAAGGVQFFVIKGIYDPQAAFNGVFTL